MAILRHLATGERVRLRAHHVFGRGPVSTVVPVSVVSAVHAELRWDGAAWVVVDRSTNGTFLDGQIVSRQRSATLREGQVLSLGSPHQPDASWAVDDLGPPPARAVADDGRVAESVHNVITLGESTQIGLSRLSEWLMLRAESDQDLVVRDGDVVTVDGHAWTLSLPTILVGTSPPAEDDPRRVVLCLASDREVSLAWGRLRATSGTYTDLPRRNCLRLAVVLAREAALPGSDGWVHRDDLCTWMDWRPTQLAVEIFKLRQLLVEAGVAGGHLAVERANTSVRLVIPTELTVR